MRRRSPGGGRSRSRPTARRHLRVEPLEGRTLLSAGEPWAFSIGSTESDGFYRGVVDPDGNAYVVGGYDAAIDLDPGEGTFPLSNPIGFVAKYDSDGRFVWGRNPGSGQIALAGGSVYATGFLWGTYDFGNGAPLTSFGEGDVFTVRYSAVDGTVQDVWRMGGPATERGWAVAVDGTGNIITIGQFAGTTDFDPGEDPVAVANLTSAGGNDLFVSKLDAAGNYLWARRFGNAANEECYGVTTDPDGNIYITGGFGGTVDFGGHLLTSRGGWDGFVAKIDPSGEVQWAQRMGGDSSSGNERGFVVAVDATAGAKPADWRVYVAGTVTDTADFGSFTLPSTGGDDAYLAQLDTAGTFKWANRWGGGGQDFANAMSLDPWGNIYVAGQFGHIGQSADFDPGPGERIFVPRGFSDSYVTKFGREGNHLSAWQISASNPDRAWLVGVDRDGMLYVGGQFQGNLQTPPDGATLLNVTPPTNPRDYGADDAYLLKMDPQKTHLDGTVYFDKNQSGSFSAEPGMPGWTVFLDANANGVLDAGEVSTTTDHRGRYGFDLGPGDYTVRLVAQDGWSITTPADPSYAVTIPADRDPSLPLLAGDFGAYRAWQQLEYSVNGPAQATANPKVFTSSIVIGGAEQVPITDLDVTATISDYDLDGMRVTLISPPAADGTQVRALLYPFKNAHGMTLFNTVFDDEADGSILDGTAPFNGRFRPEGQDLFQDSLWNTYGKDARGTWTLEIENWGTAINPMLYDWSLSVFSANGIGGNPPDGPPSIRVLDVVKTEGNGGTTAFDFTVALSAPSLSPVTVKYATANGTATAGSDYKALANQTLTFSAGTTLKTITVYVSGDGKKEANETFFVNLSNAVGATIARGRGTGLILDDDSPSKGASVSTAAAALPAEPADSAVKKTGLTLPSDAVLMDFLAADQLSRSRGSSSVAKAKKDPTIADLALLELTTGY